MDTIPERVGKGDPLLGLFQGAGRTHAPVDLEDRVRNQLSATHLPLTPQASLIGAKGWTVITAIAAVILLAGTQLASTSSVSLLPWSEVLALSHWTAFEELFASSWLMAMVAGVAVVTTLERLLRARAAHVFTR